MIRRLLLALALCCGAAGAHAAACPSLPYTLTNGTLADANKVMANFNDLLTCVNDINATLVTAVIGGITTTVDEPMVWANTSGTLAKNGLGTNIAHSDTQAGAITVTTSPFTTYSNEANGINAAYIWSGVNLATPDTGALSLYDGMRSVVVNNLGSTTNNIEAIGAYVLNNAVAGAQGAGIGGTASGVVSEIISNVDGASSWGMNVLCTDNAGQVVTSHGARACFGSEFDLNFTSTASSGIAYMAGGASLVQPASAVGFNCNRLDGYPGTGGIAQWNFCLGSTDGSTLNIIDAGTGVSHAVTSSSISSTTLTVVSLGDFDIVAKGAPVTGAGVTGGTAIVAQLTGDPGKAGTYTVNNSQSVSLETIYVGLPASSQSILLSAYDATGNQSNGVIQYDGFKELLLNASVSGGTVRLLSNSVISASFMDDLVQLGNAAGPVHFATSQVSAPALSSCGTSPAIIGTDTAGTVSMGTGSPAGCVITFVTPYTVTPVCPVTWRGTPLASQSYDVSTTAITLNQTPTSNNTVDYICFAQAGG